jgi:hypothetical protein
MKNVPNHEIGEKNKFGVIWTTFLFYFLDGKNHWKIYQKRSNFDFSKFHQWIRRIFLPFMENANIVQRAKFHANSLRFLRLSQDRKKRHLRSSICHRLRKFPKPTTHVDSARRADHGAMLHIVIAGKLSE